MNISYHPNYTNSDSLSPSGFYIAASFLFLVWFFGCFNNFLAILAIVSNRCLRTPMNGILLNLSLSDLSISALGTPLSFVAALNQRWPFGQFLCYSYGFFMTLTGMTAVGTVTVIAVERYVILSRHYQSAGLTKEKAVACIVCIWIYALSMSLPPLFGWNRYTLETPGIACSVDWETKSVTNTSYIIYIFILGYFAPILIMASCYGKVIYIVCKGPKMIKNKKKAKAEQRVTMMAAAMVVCTLTAWTPYAVVSLMVTTGYSHIIGPIASVAPAIFAKTSVIYNPIVYFFLNTQVNKALKKKFQRRSTTERNEDFSVTTNYFYTVDSIRPTVAVATSVPIKSKKSAKIDTSKV
ncbi:vertebrate ancient opsin-like isoform X1 [Centruroides vittatus]|uniref:vertebrate ancient opsin-like isoform X1 n=1 Tax=Centruroides vittatus TaxID=120091 RepID=UPI00350F92F4